MGLYIPLMLLIIFLDEDQNELDNIASKTRTTFYSSQRRAQI